MFFSYVVVIIVVVSSDARGSVQIYVLCDKKMNTKEQHTSAFSQSRDITMRFKESAKRALNLILFSYNSKDLNL